MRTCTPLLALSDVSPVPTDRETDRRSFIAHVIDSAHARWHHSWRVFYLSGWRVPVVEMLFIGVHPNLCSPHGILEEVWPCVRGLFRKNVAYVRAGMNLQAAPTLPHLLNDKHSQSLWHNRNNLMLELQLLVKTFFDNGNTYCIPIWYFHGLTWVRVNKPHIYAKMETED